MHGTTNRVISVEIVTPPMTVTAMGMRVSAPGPKAKAGGIAAPTVDAAVISIGRRRVGQAFNNASR